MTGRGLDLDLYFCRPCLVFIAVWSSGIHSYVASMLVNHVIGLKLEIGGVNMRTGRWEG
jgi:hypothetical protein